MVILLGMIWVVPLLPALGFVVNGLFGTRFLTKKAVAWIACSAVLLSFLLSLGAILALNGVEGLAPTPGLAVDPWMRPMNCVMACCASGVVVILRLSPSTLVSRIWTLACCFSSWASASALAWGSL